MEKKNVFKIYKSIEQLSPLRRLIVHFNEKNGEAKKKKEEGGIAA